MQVVLDGAMLAAACILAYLLRFDFQIPPEYLRAAVAQLPAVVLFQLLVLHLAGANRFVWRYVGLEELGTFLRAAMVASVPVLVARLLLPDALKDWRMPLSVIVMDSTLAFVGIVGLRVLRRVLYEKYERVRREPTASELVRKVALLVGAGRAGVLVAREIRSRGDVDIEPIGFVDDDPEKQGAIIQGLPVRGTTSDLEAIVRQFAVEEVVITMAKANTDTLRSVVESCERLGVRPRIVPRLDEIASGHVEVSRFRDVQIEDLLGREEVKLDDEQVGAFLGGKSILVTGAGGSVGSELVRQVARYGPTDVTLVERSEPALFQIDSEMRRLFPYIRFHACVADAGDVDSVRTILRAYLPNVILHAAAHKHVHLMETNVADVVKNNVLVTRRLAELAGEENVEAFVLVSSDKAVRPSSVMGATTRVAELVVQDAQLRYPLTRFVAVRFGNVMGSAGSVIPIFRQQIEAGGPVTVTHSEATRYFMTIHEAARLVLQAGAIGRAGQIMILDMGEPVRIVDLARDMIRLSALKPGHDIRIEFIGLRPGEKLVEELCIDEDEVEITTHEKIFVGQIQPCVPGRLSFALARLTYLAREGDVAGIRFLLAELVPEAGLASPQVRVRDQPGLAVEALVG